MHAQGEGEYNYAATDDWQAVELPYAGSDLAMWVLVPTGAAGPGELLAPDVLAAVGHRLAPSRIDLSLPRWDFGSNINQHGTEAAAATRIEADSGPIPFRADRPFAVAIVHGPTNTPLFIGHVADPADTAGSAG